MYRAISLLSIKMQFSILGASELPGDLGENMVSVVLGQAQAFNRTLPGILMYQVEHLWCKVLIFK